MAEDVKINITTKADGSGAKQAQKDVNDVGDSVEKAGAKAKKASFDFKEFATNAGLGATAMLGGIVGIASMAVKSAGEYETSQLAFTTLLGDSKKAKQEIADIQKQAVETPFNLPELIKANQLLVSAGVGAKDAQEDILNLGKAVSSTGGSSADLLRMAGNLQQIKAIGKASAQDIKQFGFAGIPIYQLLADVTGKNVDEIKDMDIGYEDLTAALSKAGQAGGRYADSFKNASESFQVKFSNLQDAIGIGMTKIANDSGLFRVVKDAISGLTEFINTTAVPQLTKFFDFLSSNPQALIVLAGIIGGLLVAAAVGFVVAFGPMIAAALAFAAAGAAIAFAFSFIAPYITQLWAVVQPFFQQTSETIRAFIQEHMPAFQAFWDVIVNLWNMSLGYLQGYWSTVWGGISQVFKGIWEIIVGALRAAFGVMTVLFGVFQGIFTGDWNKAWKTISIGFKDIWEGIKTFFSGILDAMIGLVKTFVNNFIGTINGLITGVNNISGKVPALGGVKIPLIPHLEKGTDFFSGGIALVGERGPEIVNLPRGSQVIPNNKIGGQSGAPTIYQTNYISSGIDMEIANRDLAFAIANR